MTPTFPLPNNIDVHDKKWNRSLYYRSFFPFYELLSLVPESHFIPGSSLIVLTPFLIQIFILFLKRIESLCLCKCILQACDCSLSKELQAYEVEYHVLQEEAALSPLNNAEFNKLKEANKNLKRQNLDLLEQLHQANSHQHALEASNQV